MKVDSVHKKRLKAIRPFVKFNYNLNSEFTPYQKRKIKKYYDEIEALNMRSSQVYRPRIRKNLEAAQKFAQHNPGFSELKVAFIPIGKDPVKIRVRRGKVQTKTDFISTVSVEFNTDDLIADPVKHVMESVEEQAPNAKAYTVNAGRFEVPMACVKETLPNLINRLATKYSDDTKNNFFGNWMNGLKAHTFDNQNTLKKYMSDKSKKNKELKRINRNKKSAESYAKRRAQVGKEYRPRVYTKGYSKAKGR